MAGIHHITAVGKDMHFYSRVLGLNFVKKTVNFDDPYTYHLYFGDEVGSPGTALTFFLWEMPPVRRGTGQISTIMYEASDLDAWEKKLKDYQPKRYRRFGDDLLEITDPNGMILELVDTGKEDLHTFYGVTLNVTAFEKDILEGLGFKQTKQEGNMYRFQGDDVMDIMVSPNAAPGKLGNGGIHHVAFRAKDDEEQMHMRQKLIDMGLRVTPQIDRKYFRSIYFHIPSGVLFEIATEGPGFLIDEEELGSSLVLPAQYEHMRQDIERHLPKIGEIS